MSIAVFATKYFEVNSDKIYTPKDLKYSVKLNTEKQDSASSKPSTYIKDVDLATLDFSLKLDVANGVNPRTEWEDWEGILESSIPYQFILGSKPIGSNKFLLVGVDPDNFVVDNEGNILVLDLALSFEEYVREGSKKSSQKSSKGSKKSSSKKAGVSGLSDTEFASLIDDE